ncbi:hypothetical protein INT45_004498 [Circinella minor]|uniref:Uncharacterized protein n=1 Tax=Circinella minor TaxID=1195481 RepID=A0A8H7VJ53_9FUNG|nr:hypothetical protein INT45_004498 [Circinella minor]
MNSSSLLYTPEKPKLTPQKLNKLCTSCDICLSCVENDIPAHLQHEYETIRQETFQMISITKFENTDNMIKAALQEGVDSEDVVYGLWNADREARQTMGTTDNEKEVNRLPCLGLTDFRSMCMNDSFRGDHERSFWVERVVHSSNTLDRAQK